MHLVDTVYDRMVAYYHGDPHQIQHFVKVHSFAALIGREEGLDPVTQKTLEIAALVHDIGIKPAMEKFGSSSGPLQEQEGPAQVRALLEDMQLPKTMMDRVCWLVSRHHTYTGVDGADYRILLEADFLVNCFESGYTADAARASIGSVFETETGTRLLKTMFGL